MNGAQYLNALRRELAEGASQSMHQGISSGSALGGSVIDYRVKRRFLSLNQGGNAGALVPG